MEGLFFDRGFENPLTAGFITSEYYNPKF